MFSWFKKKQNPPATPGNANPSSQPRSSLSLPEPYQDLGHTFQIAFAGPWGTRDENINLVDVLAQVLRERGHDFTRQAASITLDPSGLQIAPIFAGMIQPRDDGGASTTTVTRVSHPSFGGAEVFEFQHAASATAEQSARQGLDQWCQVDLVALLDSLRDKPSACTIMQMEFGPKDGAPARTRRVVLSPVAYFAQRPLPAPPAKSDAASEAESQHGSFCPCCLFTNTFDAFKDQIESDGFHALRLYASRDPDGHPTADCRINGLDYDPGKLALCKYVERWPDQGVEFRKQYVLIQNAPPRTEK